MVKCPNPHARGRGVVHNSAHARTHKRFDATSTLLSFCAGRECCGGNLCALNPFVAVHTHTRKRTHPPPYDSLPPLLTESETDGLLQRELVHSHAVLWLP